ncbi:MAG TPA: choice-of-anchor Q domain-containing protein, partial [Rudaea sp.]
MNGRKTSTRHSAQALTLFCALALPACGWSNTIACVTNNSQLVTALNEVQFTPLTIKVATGNYDLKNTFWHGQLSNGFYTYTSASQLAQISSGSEILGGYNNDCSTRSIAVGNTTFTDSGITDSIVDDGAFPLGDFTLEGVTWSVRNGVWLLSGFAPFNAKTGSMVLLRRNAFINAPNNGPNILWEQTDDGGSIVRIVENLFASNAIGSHCALSVEATGGSPAVQVINNTVVDNSGSGARGACFDNVNYPPEGTSGNATYYIYNNIFFGSGSKDLEILDENRTTQLALLYDNVVGSRVAGTSPEFETNTQTGDPKLDGNYQPIQAPVSPVINTGNNSVPGGLPSVDLAGQPRLVGSRVDRGAYESTVDFSNVQMVSKHGFDDGSAGTLSAAVANINTNNGGSIKFNITDGGACPWVITLGDELDIAANATINGYSQIGSSTNDLDPGDDAKLCIIVEAG